jgi:hypothetical protein
VDEERGFRNAIGVGMSEREMILLNSFGCHRNEKASVDALALSEIGKLKEQEKRSKTPRSKQTCPDYGSILLLGAIGGLWSFLDIRTKLRGDPCNQATKL